MLRKAFVVALAILLVCSPFFSVSKSVSASTNLIYWGAWVGNSHIGDYNLLTSFEGQVGKSVSIWNWIQLWNRPQDSENYPNFNLAIMNQARSHGAIPMVSWGPEAGWTDFPFANLDSIISGSQDQYLIKWGQDSAAWGHPYFVRLMWEFTGGWTYDDPSHTGIYPWGYGNSPAKFVQAWQHVVNVVRGAGGTQISWVWCTGDVGDSVSTLQSVYPGDNYVDWVGTDIYGDMVHSGDVELTNIHNAIPQKPVMIPEIGYTGGDSSYWSTLLSSTLPNQFPYVKAVVIWEMPSASLTVVGSKTLSAFKQGIASSHYSSNVYGSLSISPTAAIGENLNHTSTPMSQVPSGIGLSDTIIVGVIAAIAVVAVVLVLRKKYMKNTKIEVEKPEEELNLNFELSRQNTLDLSN